MTIMTLEVKSAAKVEGKFGPQWELSYIAPFSKFPQKGWIDREEEQELVPGSYICDIIRDKLREGKEGAYDYNWNWKILRFNVEGESDEYRPSAPTDDAKAEVATRPRPETTTSYDTYESARVVEATVKRHSIHRQVALKAAVEILTPTANPSNKDMSYAALSLATDFFAWLQEPFLAPSKPAEADSGAEPSEDPAEDAWRSLGEQVGGEEEPNYGADGEPMRQFANMGDLRTALSKDFDLTTKQQCDKAYGSDINLADSLSEVYATIKPARQVGN